MRTYTRVFDLMPVNQGISIRARTIIPRTFLCSPRLENTAAIYPRKRHCPIINHIPRREKSTASINHISQLVQSSKLASPAANKKKETYIICAPYHLAQLRPHRKSPFQLHPHIHITLFFRALNAPFSGP